MLQEVIVLDVNNVVERFRNFPKALLYKTYSARHLDVSVDNITFTLANGSVSEACFGHYRNFVVSLFLIVSDIGHHVNRAKLHKDDLAIFDTVLFNSLAIFFAN